MSQQTCPRCNGCGQVVEPIMVPKDDGTYDRWDQAVTCSTCGGTGKVG